MRIVHVCGWYFPDSLGGTETYVSAVAARLRAAGHHVVVAAPDPAGHGERSYPHEGMTVYRYPIPSVPTRDEAQHVVVARGAERFHAWLAQQRPDVVHFHTFVTGLGLHEIRAARTAGARVIATTHSGSLGFTCQRGTMLRFGREACDGVVAAAKCAACELQHRRVPLPLATAASFIPVPLARAARSIPGKLGTFLAMPDFIARNQELQHQMLSEVDAFVVLTQQAHDIVVRNDGNGNAPRVILNRLGVRTDTAHLQAVRSKPRKKRPHLTIAYLGRFDRIKGVHDLARAARALPKHVRIHLEFRGPVNNLQDATIANELKMIVGPDAWVTFGPPVEPAEVFDYLYNVDLLCCPSRTMEGGPTVALEAMGVGTPVLATRLGAMAELIEDGVTGRLIRAGDWRALSRAMTEIASNPVATIETWRRNLPAVRTMDDVTRDYLELYTR
jgi:glycosyltransferase involved in cell wall biosynthesis